MDSAVDFICVFFIALIIAYLPNKKILHGSTYLELSKRQMVQNSQQVQWRS